MSLRPSSSSGTIAVYLAILKLSALHTIEHRAEYKSENTTYRTSQHPAKAASNPLSVFTVCHKKNISLYFIATLLR
jgi:hypothetical protein